MNIPDDLFARQRDMDRGPAAALLGHRLVSVDPDNGEVEVAFQAAANLFNPMGVMQGGLIMAMLEMALTDAAAILSRGGDFSGNQSGETAAPAVTLLDVHCHFLAAVGPGPLRCRARLRHGGRSTAFVEAELFAPSGTPASAPTGTLAATASAVADFAPPGAKVS